MIFFISKNSTFDNRKQIYIKQWKMINLTLIEFVTNPEKLKTAVF